MTQTEQRLLFATGLVLLVGSVLFVALGGLSKPEPLSVSSLPVSKDVDPIDAATGRPLAPPDSIIPGPGNGARDQDLRPGGTGIPNGLREPSGEDLSDPKTVLRLLREHLAEANPRWDYVAKLLQVFRAPLDADIKATLVAALEHGNAAGALQALAFLNDGTIVPDLLRLLDGPAVDKHDLGTLLIALSTIPGANPAEVVTGIESRLTGDFAHDSVFLQAIARTGGAEAVRALLDAIIRAKDPSEIGADVWRELDLKKSPDAANRLASTLRSTTLTPAALGAIVAMAGQPGASREVIEALLALDADATPEPVRRRVLESLGATSDDAALDHILSVAVKGADYASVAAKAVSEIRSATPAMRAKLLESATQTNDENLRMQLVHALGSLRAAPAVPLLTGYLVSPQPMLRIEAAIALGRIGPESASALDALAKAYEAGDEAMRQHVAIAIGRVGNDRAASILKQFQVIEKSERVKTTLNGAVRALGPK